MISVSIAISIITIGLLLLFIFVQLGLIVNELKTLNRTLTSITMHVLKLRGDKN